MNQMISLKQRLMSLEKDIRVAVVGIGSMGKGLVYQVHNTPGMKPVVLCDIKIEKAIQCAEWLGQEYDTVESVSDLNFTVQRGKIAVTNNADLLTSSSLVHVLIESTNAVFEGALHAKHAISSHQHVVMMNFEADLMYGPSLMKAAQEEGVVYTCADGDKPTAIKKLIDEIRLYGFDLVMAGNIKNFQDRYTNPSKIGFEADMRNLDHQMCAYFADGTKTSVEMAVLANAIDGRTIVPGMHGHHACTIHDVFKHYDFEKTWNGENPLVDYLIGAEPRGGVFVVGYTEDQFQRHTLEWFPPDIGPGPFYLFYRPYYLGHIEAMQCIAEAYLENTARLQPAFGMKTNVFAYAKKEIKAGQILDGKGGEMTYGLIENMGHKHQQNGLPILISDGMKVKRDIRKDQRLTLDDIEFDLRDDKFKWYFEASGISTNMSKLNNPISNLDVVIQVK